MRMTLLLLAAIFLSACGDPGDTTMDACVGGLLINSQVNCQMRYTPCTAAPAGTGIQTYQTQTK